MSTVLNKPVRKPVNPLVKPKKKYVKKIKYINNEDGKGWLKVKHHPKLPGAPDDEYPPLPQYLKVETYREENGREYFTILEGLLRGKKASVSLRAGKSRLQTAVSHSPGGKIRFDRKNKKLWYGSNGPVAAFTEIKPGTNDPLIPLGTWNLQIPYEVHKDGAGYLSNSKYAKTWFRIITPTGDVNDRYLHPGKTSWGCATVNAVDDWTAIYNYLIKRRKGDLISVGTIEVFDGPTPKPATKPKPGTTP